MSWPKCSEFLRNFRVFWFFAPYLEQNSKVWCRGTSASPPGKPWPSPLNRRGFVNFCFRRSCSISGDNFRLLWPTRQTRILLFSRCLIVLYTGTYKLLTMSLASCSMLNGTVRLNVIFLLIFTNVTPVKDWPSYSIHRALIGVRSLT